MECSRKKERTERDTGERECQSEKEVLEASGSRSAVAAFDRTFVFRKSVFCDFFSKS